MRKKHAVGHQLTTSHSSSRGSFFFVEPNEPTTRTTRTHFHLSREYQLLTYSLDFFKTKNGSKRLVVLYPPVGGGRGGLTIQMATMIIIDATNRKIAVRKAALQNLRS